MDRGVLLSGSVRPIGNRYVNRVAYGGYTPVIWVDGHWRAIAKSWFKASKRYVPPGIKLAVKDAWRRHTLAGAVRHLIRLPPGELPSRSMLMDLRVGWGNEGWSGNLDFMEEVARRAATTAGPILECGSGVTTVLLGLLAGRRGVEVWSLENMPEWQSRVSRMLDRHPISRVRVCLSPLREYGGFEWYALPPGMPESFDLVVCDGPGVSYRSRYGLLPVLGQRLSAGSFILVDDPLHMADVMHEWLTAMPLELVASSSQFSVLRVAR
jgi:hypothetical protein